MKCFIFLSVMMISCSASAQTDNEAQIRSLMAKQQAAWNAADVNGFMQGYWQNDSLLFIGSSGPQYGWNNMLDGYKKHYPDATAMGKLLLDILQMKKLSDEYYFVLGKWMITRKSNNVGGNFTLLFKKIDGNWMIISDHSD